MAKTDTAELAELKREKAAAEKRAKDLEARLKKDGAKGAAMAEASKHMDKDTAKIAEAAQKMASNGEVDAKGMANMASILGEKAGIDNDYLKVIQSAGGEKLDMEKAASVPGLIVDKETGKISVLGLFDLDAKDPTSKMIANAVIGGYSLLALNANEAAFPRIYKTAADAALKVGPLAAHSHHAGLAAAGSVVGAVSFWPDITNAVQQEKQGRQTIEGIAQRFAPLLNEYYPNAGGMVSKLYAVKGSTNQMIVNERTRAAANQNAERFKNSVEVLGRVPLFAASVGYGMQAMGGAKQEAETAAEAAKQKKPKETPEQLKMRLLKEKTEAYATELKIDREAAAAMAKEELDGKKLTGADSEEKGGILGRFKRDVVGGSVLAAAPLVSILANNLYKKRLEDRGIQAISASDMVEHLGKQLDDNPKAERFSLPKGMSELGSKTGNNQLKLEDYLEQVFKQHERDTYGNDASIPSRFAEPLQEACTLIADELRADKMDGRIALIKLVGEQQVVRSGGRFVADADTVKELLAVLESDLFLRESILDPKAELDDMGLSPQVIRENWQRFSEEERGFMACDIAPQLLEYAGVDPREVQTLRAQYKSDFSESLANVMENLASLENDMLKANGATSGDMKIIDQFTKKLHANAKEGEPKEASNLAQTMSRGEIADARRVVANLVLADGAKHDGSLALAGMKNR